MPTVHFAYDIGDRVMFSIGSNPQMIRDDRRILPVEFVEWKITEVKIVKSESYDDLMASKNIRVYYRVRIETDVNEFRHEEVMEERLFGTMESFKEAIFDMMQGSLTIPVCQK